MICHSDLRLATPYGWSNPLALKSGSLVMGVSDHVLRRVSYEPARWVRLTKTPNWEALPSDYFEMSIRKRVIPFDTNTVLVVTKDHRDKTAPTFKPTNITKLYGINTPIRILCTSLWGYSNQYYLGHNRTEHTNYWDLEQRIGWSEIIEFCAKRMAQFIWVEQRGSQFVVVDVPSPQTGFWYKMGSHNFIEIFKRAFDDPFQKDGFLFNKNQKQFAEMLQILFLWYGYTAIINEHSVRSIKLFVFNRPYIAVFTTGNRKVRKVYADAVRFYSIHAEAPFLVCEYNGIPLLIGVDP